jgi:hypothetical protein
MEKCGSLPKGPKYLRKNGYMYVCMSQPGHCQATGTSAETNNEELLIARQRFRNRGYIDGNN